MTAPSRLAHIVFRTRHLATMIDWYCRVLEARVVFANQAIAFLSYDDEHHRVALLADESFAEKPAETQVGFYHVAFAYDSLGQLLDKYRELLGAGIAPSRTINHGPTLSFYYKDPDGNDIEMQVDRFRNPHDAIHWMQGEAYARNPIGVLVDPEVLADQLRTGVPFDVIARRADE
jgi:catechol-2,3-dioxygenase